MNKSELIEAIAGKADISKVAAGRALDAVVESIQEALVSGAAVSIIGFGTFEGRTRSARDGKNPKTGEAIKIPASVTPAFKAGKTFKDALNKTRK